MRMMVVFEKGAELRFIGHLDLMRTIQRALRRSGLPIQYSNGFNPHIRLSFAAPLSVGVVGLRELMEVPLEDGTEAEDFVQRMNAVLPGCLQVIFAKPMGETFPTLMSLVAGSRYTIVLPEGETADKAEQCFEPFMALKEYVANRRTKSGENPCDIRPFVLDGSAERKNGQLVIHLTTVCTAAGALKPSLWLQCLLEFANAEPADAMIYREAILAKDKNGKLAPMEEVGNG